jgi:hypothetical protein
MQPIARPCSIRQIDWQAGIALLLMAVLAKLQVLANRLR